MAGLVFRILFVCDANTFRSPVAEFLLRTMLANRGVEGVEVCSGGVASHARDGCMVSQDAILLLREEGVMVPEEPFSKDLKRHRELVEGADLVLTMTRRQKELILGMNGGRGAVYTLKEYVGGEGDIEDPRVLGEESYRACKEEIKGCLEKLIEKLLTK
ncbi:MAG: low molecular weight protein arginine phosphatase [Candidatus Freyarchaeota archaeon]|nr:low molecular weight protein arginine phosphatase [Candidatus Jordarchaeia archaeon]